MTVPAQAVLWPCCEWWARAQQWGTDNEGYARLIHWRDDGPHMGYVTENEADDCYLPAVEFCPWCGTKKTEPKP